MNLYRRGSICWNDFQISSLLGRRDLSILTGLDNCRLQQHNTTIVPHQSTIVKPSENTQVSAREWGNLKIIPTNRSTPVKVHLTIKSPSISPGSTLLCSLPAVIKGWQLYNFPIHIKSSKQRILCDHSIRLNEEKIEENEKSVNI